ncbi:MAG: hypothetical protein Fur0014_03540 [Rubrivivax sp.]
MRRAPHPSNRGFTLTEMLIAMLIVAILGAIAIPSFNDSIRKGRRSDAMTAIAAVQQAQERWRGSRPAYSSSLTELGFSSSSPSGYYTLTLGGLGGAGDEYGNGYIVTATANTGTSQAADTDCARMSVRMQGGTLAYAGGSADGALNYTETHACFAR